MRFVLLFLILTLTPSFEMWIDSPKTILINDLFGGDFDPFDKFFDALDIRNDEKKQRDREEEEDEAICDGLMYHDVEQLNVEPGKDFKNICEFFSNIQEEMDNMD